MLGRKRKGLLYFSDVGYGNYLLTAPVERNQRQLWEDEAKTLRQDSSSIEKIDVSELLSPANTLTNPFAPSKKDLSNKIEL